MKIDSSISAIVTGGGSGLGAATARRLTGLGAKVAVLDLDSAQGDARLGPMARSGPGETTDSVNSGMARRSIEQRRYKWSA